MQPGFGLRQSPGAFLSLACQEKRQRTRRASAHPNLLFCFPAVQDAIAPCHRSRRSHGPNAYAKRKEALHEPLTHSAGWQPAVSPIGNRRCWKFVWPAGWQPATRLSAAQPAEPQPKERGSATRSSRSGGKPLNLNSADEAERQVGKPQMDNYGRLCISLRKPHPTGERLTSCQPFPICAHGRLSAVQLPFLG